LYKILYSDKLKLVVIKHFGSYVGAEGISASKDFIADARFTKTHVVLQDMRLVTSMTLHDTDWAFAQQTAKKLEPLEGLKIALLRRADNPINKIHDARRLLIQQETPHPNHLLTTSFKVAAGWLGLDERDLSIFIQQNFDTQE
jgi:hypothetical protein